MCLRLTVHIPAGKTAHLIYATAVASTREEVLALADKYHDARTFERTRTLAWTQAQVQLQHLGISADEAHLFQRLANAVIYSDPSLRPSSDVLSSSPLERSTLWAQGISGDLPIVLARIDDTEDFELIRQLLRAHEYWRMKQLSADVVIINEKAASYVQELQGSLEALVRGKPVEAFSRYQRSKRKDFPAARRPGISADARPASDRCARYPPQPPRHSRRTDFEIADSRTCRSPAT